MLDDAEHAAGLQRAEHRGERLRARRPSLIQLCRLRKVTTMSSAAGRHDRIAAVGRSVVTLDLAVEIRARGELGREVPRGCWCHVLACRMRGRHRARSSLPLLAQQRREDLGVPAAAPGQTSTHASSPGGCRRTAASLADGDTTSRARFSAERWSPASMRGRARSLVLWRELLRRRSCRASSVARRSSRGDHCCRLAT